MAQCEINHGTVSNGIQSYAANKMDNSNLFEKEDELYRIVDEENSDHQSLIDNINIEFGEELVMKMGLQPYYVVTEPSEQLVNKYLTEALGGINTVASDDQDIFLSANELPQIKVREFQELQRLGLISQESNIVNGREYYKIPGKKDPEQLERLEAIIKERGLDFINIEERIDSYQIEVGEIEQDLDDSQLPITTSSKASTITKVKVLNFLENIGFKNIQLVDRLEYKGEKIKGSAYINFIDGVMQIVKGTEDYTLPEESMHILTQLIKQSRPQLFQSMMKDVVNYKLYSAIVNDPDYNTKDQYKNDDGTLNYEKLKEEAVAKILAEHLINGLEATKESERRLETVRNWWKQIVQWIREKFGAYKNPFKKALEELNKNNKAFGEYADISSDEMFFSAKTVEEIDAEHPETKALWENIKDKAALDNVSKVDSEYFKDNQKVSETQRVSDLVDRYYTKLFGNRNFDEATEAMYEQHRQDGTYLHEIVEQVIKSWVDPETGLIRRSPAPISFPIEGNPLQGEIVTSVRKFIGEFMSAYPEGTRFLTEQIIYDPNAVNADKSKGRFGTVDFLAIVPTDNGPRADLIDWKSILMEDLEGAKDYKRGAIFVQLGEYTRILKDVYGVQQFGKIRAVPIRPNYKINKQTKERNLVGIQVGNANAIKITQDKSYLRPIISPKESTGSPLRDKLVQKLEALYQKYIDRGYFREDVTILRDVQEAIYETRVNNSINNLVGYFGDLLDKFNIAIPQFETLKDGKKEDINEALSLISFYEDIIKNVVEPSFALIKDKTIDEANRDNLKGVAAQLIVLKGEFEESRKILLNSLSEKNGIFGLLLPEKAVNLFRRWFRSMGSQDIASVRLMYSLAKKAFNRITLQVDGDLKTLAQMKFDFEEWRKKKNLTEKQAIDMLVDMKKGKIHGKISQDFFSERELAIRSKNAKTILKFVTDNYNLEDWKEWYEKTLAENIKFWRSKSSSYSDDPKKNEIMIKKKIDTFAKTYNILKYPITAFNFTNNRVWTKNLKEEKWLSEEYKKIEKEKPLLDMYNFMLNKNKELVASGALKDIQQYTFFPNIRKTFADSMKFEDSNVLSTVKDVAANWYNNMRKSLTIEDYELNFQGATDPFTGQKLDKRFIPYIANIEADKQSFDIFTVYGLMSKEIAKERNLQENDEIFRSLVHMERMKPTLLANTYGKISKSPTGEMELSKKVGQNAPVLEEHMRALVNGESLQIDSDFAIQLRLKESWNKTPMAKWYGGKLAFDLNKEYKPSAISTTKFIMWLNNTNTRRILGANLSASLSNLLGGTYASNKIYSRYIGKGDIANNYHRIVSGRFYASDDMKKRAALVDYFLPLLNNREAFKASQLSVSQASTVLSQEWLMAPMRKTSEIVQLNIFLAVIENTGIIDGKIVNLRDKLSKEMDYHNRHNLPYAEVGAFEKEFEKKLDEYKDKYGIIKHATFKTVKEAGKDKLVIDLPGMDRNGPEVEQLRDIVQTMSKDALGEADEFDLQNYKYNMWWRLFMTFINWIPRQAEVRWGEFRFDQAHNSHEYGRYRMFAKALGANMVQTIVKLGIPIPYLTGKVTNFIFTKEAIIKRAKEVYAVKVQEAKDMGKWNEDTFITQGEFIDKYIKGVDSTFEELRTLMFMNLLMFFGLANPDDDDDSETKAWKAMVRKQVDKLSDEIGFFYSPKSFIDILGNRPPVMSLVRDMWHLGTNTYDQVFGFTLEGLGWDEKGIKMQEKAKPMKRLFKVVPVFKEILTYLPAMNEDLAKEWGVKVMDRRGF